MAAQGTTTVEAKSGYGLSFEAEIKSLEAIADAAQQWQGTVVPTLLGAHVVAPEYRDNPEEYVRIVCEEMIPAARAPSASSREFVDVFCERGAFSMQQSQRILRAAVDHGLGVRVHVCQLTPAQLSSAARVRSGLARSHGFRQRRRHRGLWRRATRLRRCCLPRTTSSGCHRFRPRANSSTPASPSRSPPTTTPAPRPRRRCRSCSPRPART